jgi:hypothetical protein
MRRKVLVLLVVGLLASVSAAFAAFHVFTNTVGGTGTGAFTSTTTSTDALTLTQTSNPPALGPGDSGQLGFSLHNSSTAAHTVQSTTATFTVSGASGTAGNGDNADCAAHLSMTAENITGSSPPPGTDATGRVITVQAAANTPIGCKGSSYFVALAGATS